MRRALAILLVVGGTLLGWSAAVDAATVTDAGWWDRNADALIPQLDPPPEGALRVANDPAGAGAIAAVRFTLDPGEQDPMLTLRVVGDPVPDGAALVACPATTEWSGADADGAPLSEAPEFDCEAGAALGLVAGGGAAVSFDLTQLPPAETVDIVISPAPTGESPITDTFTVDFDAPVSTDVTVAAADPASPSAPAGPTAGDSAPPPVAGGGSAPSPSFTPSRPPSGSVQPPAPSVTLPVTRAPTATTPAAPTAPTASGDESASPAAEASPAADKRWIGLLTAALIVGLGVYLWRADRARAAMTAGPVLGGLGPFVRERTGPAPDVA